MLTKISIVCFAASYLVALCLEVSRLFFRAPVRLVATLAMTCAGLFAHSVYLVMRAAPNPNHAPPLSSWFDWLLVLSWGIAATYLVASLRRPQAALGIFMLPMVLALIAVATLFRDAEPFPRGQSLYIWGMVHGGALLAGAVVVMLGFVAGIMYLLQSYRLKHKLPPRQGLKLPSLEWLQRMNRQSLVISSVLLCAGLLSGIALNLVKQQQGVPWSDPVVWTSAVLFLWLAIALSFEYFYKPAQQGRKVAYLTLASFVFLGLVLGIILLVPSEHASADQSPQSTDVRNDETSVGGAGGGS